MISPLVYQHEFTTAAPQSLTCYQFSGTTAILMHPIRIGFSLELTDAQVDFPHFRAIDVQNLGN